MLVRHLEQIVKGMRVTTESEKAARRVLVSRLAKLRWCFWHGKPAQAIERMNGILMICRVRDQSAYVQAITDALVNARRSPLGAVAMCCDQRRPRRKTCEVKGAGANAVAGSCGVYQVL